MSENSNESSAAWIDANKHCCLLVGGFLNSFAFAERSLDDALAAAFNLDDLAAVMLGINIPLAKKIELTKAAMPIAGLKPRLRKHYERHLSVFADFSAPRNLMAHHPFGPTEDLNGIRLIVTTTKGKVEFPDTRWSFDDMYQKMSRLDALSQKLRDLRRELVAVHGIKRLSAILNAAMPSDGRDVQGLLGSLLRPPQDASSSSQTDTSPETGDETPPDQPEKDPENPA